MLWIAQHVVSPRGDEGINVYRYLHGAGRRTDPRDYLAEQGALASWSEELPAGGNRVRSLLDLGCPDDVTKEELLRCVSLFVQASRPPAGPVSYYGEPCAFRFDADAALQATWQAEFGRLLQAMLQAEQSGADESDPEGLARRVRDLAERGDTRGVVAILRTLAQHRWAGPMATVIDVYSNSVEVNGPAVRAFLAGLVPGILANNYYNGSGDPDFFGHWIEYTTRVGAAWAEPIRKAAASGNPTSLEREVASLGNAVVAWVAAGRP